MSLWLFNALDLIGIVLAIIMLIILVLVLLFVGIWALMVRRFYINFCFDYFKLSSTVE